MPFVEDRLQRWQRDRSGGRRDLQAAPERIRAEDAQERPEAEKGRTREREVHVPVLARRQPRRPHADADREAEEEIVAQSPPGGTVRPMAANASRASPSCPARANATSASLEALAPHKLKGHG